MGDPIDVWMVFQVIAATEDAAVDSLDHHVEKLGTEASVTIQDSSFEDVEEVDAPHPALETGYSQVCEVDMQVATFSDLVELVVNYGPTAVDVKGPDSVTLEIGEVRDALNTVASMMHQFLQAGAGGMMISRDK